MSRQVGARADEEDSLLSVAEVQTAVPLSELAAAAEALSAEHGTAATAPDDEDGDAQPEQTLHEAAAPAEVLADSPGAARAPAAAADVAQAFDAPLGDQPAVSSSVSPAAEAVAAAPKPTRSGSGGNPYAPSSVRTAKPKT